MSEFECSNGHFPAPSTIVRNKCPCGAPIIRMDGKSSGQLRAEEKDEFEKSEREKEEREYVPNRHRNRV